MIREHLFIYLLGCLAGLVGGWLAGANFTLQMIAMGDRDTYAKLLEKAREEAPK